MKKKAVFRRADTGRFTSKEYATKHPKTTMRTLRLVKTTKQTKQIKKKK